MAKNFAVAPGAYLAEWLELEAVTQQQLALRLGWSRKRVNEVVGGRTTLNHEAAIQLERVTGIPADSWTRFETAYRADLARLHDAELLEAQADIVTPALGSYLRQLEVTTATAKNRAQLVGDFLVFHGCASVDAYRGIVEDQFEGEFQLAALKESAGSVDPDLLMAWLRAGELTEAYEQAKLLTYDEQGLRALLPDLRRRVASPDVLMMEAVADMLKGVGVILQMVAPPSPFPLHGVTRWVDRKVPLIQQTGRRGKDGFIIWTLFHELGHILNDPRGEAHFEFSSSKRRNSHAEKRANEFALQTLFGEAGTETLRGLEGDHEIKAAARELGVSPGLVVFYLHRTKQLPYAWGNSLSVDLGN